jgi:hypothetical protein
MKFCLSPSKISMITKKRNKIIAVVTRPVDLALTISGTLLKKSQGDSSSIKAVICSTTDLEREKKETYKAAKIIGFEEVYFLQYKTGTLKSSGLDNVKQDIFEIFEEEKPNQVLTLGMHGYCQNPNAKATALATTLAYEKYIATLLAEHDEEEKINNACDLFYYVLPEEFFKFVNLKGFFRKDAYGFDFESIPDKKITNVIDFRKFASKKIEALKEFKDDQVETSRVIELLKRYKSAAMDYFILAEKAGEKIALEDLEKISNRL